MPRPESLRELIEPASRPDLPYDLDPCFDGWHERIAPFGWFRLRCYRHTMADAGVYRRDLLDADVRRQAVAAVPDSWRAFCPTHPDDIARWGTLSEDRVIEVVDGVTKKRTSDRRQNPSIGVSFHKAALVILALEIAAHRTRPGYDIYQRVRICPTIYQVRGFDRDLWENLDEARRDALGEAAHQTEAHALQLLASGDRPVSHGTADLVARHLGGPPGHFRVRRITTLGRPTRVVKPNHLETMYCPVTGL
ncbi:MAG: hypothetical protein WDN25_14055 [Acetobacteraceae bacterium]